MKRVIHVITTLFLLVPIILSAQNEVSEYNFYQITSAWYISPVDTVDISEDFSNDYYFAFFIKDELGNDFFTIRSYNENAIVCPGEITLESSEEEGDYIAFQYSTDVYCDPEQEEPVSRIILENIPGSKEETGFDFYYIWVVMGSDEALVFQCFDATNLKDDEVEE